jgi:uncharacterized damage-inducible protein DinB
MRKIRTFLGELPLESVREFSHAMFCEVGCQFMVEGEIKRMMPSTTRDSLEPWLRGTLRDVPAIPRAVLHALELAREDLWKWCHSLSNAQLNERPDGMASVAFHLRHISRSLDRLLSYAEERQLSTEQLEALESEADIDASHEKVFVELDAALLRSEERVRALATDDLETARTVGKKKAPSTVGGLLVHVAEHTQRHVGQAITTAKIVAAR